MSTEKSLTFGEMLVGIELNPSNSEGVAKVKELCATLANMVEDHKNSREMSDVNKLIYSNTMGELLNAQMNIVKYLTLKY
jgi:hypothetical protein